MDEKRIGIYTNDDGSGEMIEVLPKLPLTCPECGADMERRNLEWATFDDDPAPNLCFECPGCGAKGRFASDMTVPADASVVLPYYADHPHGLAV